MATSIGLSAVRDGTINHDKITRYSTNGELDSKWFWLQSKPMMEELADSQDTIFFAIDDGVAKKPYRSENELICWHYDHSKGRAPKGINFVSAPLSTKGGSLLVTMKLVRKDPWVAVSQNGKKEALQSYNQKRDILAEVTACEQNMEITYEGLEPRLEGSGPQYGHHTDEEP